MNIDDTFPSTSNFLKKEDLTRPVKVKIESVGMIEFEQNGKKQVKLDISLVGKDKRFACNKTNARMISEIYGKETDKWIGKEITLYNDPTVTMGDQVVGGIKVQYIPEEMPEDDIPF